MAAYYELNVKRYKVLFGGGMKTEHINATEFVTTQSQGGISWVVFYRHYALGNPDVYEVARFVEATIRGIVNRPRKKKHHKKRR